MKGDFKEIFDKFMKLNLLSAQLSKEQYFLSNPFALVMRDYHFLLFDTLFEKEKREHNSYHVRSFKFDNPYGFYDFPLRLSIKSKYCPADNMLSQF